MGQDFIAGRDFMGRENVPSQTSDNAWTDAEGNPTGTPQAPPVQLKGCECTFLHPVEGCLQYPTLLENDGKYAVCTNCDKRTCWACSMTNAFSKESPDKSRRHLKCPV